MAAQKVEKIFHNLIANSLLQISGLFMALLLIAPLSLIQNVYAFEGYVTNERSGDLIEIDSKANTVGVYPICNRPRGMVKAIPATDLLIACSDDNSVIRFDTKTKKIKSVISDIPGAMNLSVDGARERLIVTNEGFAKATIIDLETGTPIAELATGLEPDGAALFDKGRILFIASENAGLVHVFDADNFSSLGLIRTSLRPRRMALRENELWVSSEMGSRVEIFSVETFNKLDEIIFAPRGFRPEQMTPVDILFDSTGARAYVALGAANHVAIVNSETRGIEKYILVGRRAWGLALSEEADRLIVLNGLSDDLTMIDTKTLRPIVTKRVGLRPHSVEIY